MIRFVNYRHPRPLDAIEVTSRAVGWSRQLSPMLLGPVDLWGEHRALTVENAWQYSKVYAEHWDGTKPTPDWYLWAAAGWDNPVGVRYPMGKGVKPVCSWWNGQALTYLEARRQIYLPLYSRAVVNTPAYAQLRTLYQQNGEITILDFDVQCRNGRTWSEIFNDTSHPFGHGYVLGMMLERGI